MIDELAIGERYRALAGEFDERRRRLWAAAEARSHGRGGVTAVARATGMSATTIHKGLRELGSGGTLERGRVRRRGGGRKPLSETDPGLLEDLERLVGEDDRGDPCSPLRWTSKSVRNLAEELRELGDQVHFTTVAKLLRGLGYSLQANAKTREGASHPDRDAQFRHISETVKAALGAGEPAISVDAKKRELVGDFKAVGRELAPKGRPVEVRTHDFKDKQLGHAIPYGVLDLSRDEGWVSVGIDSNTAQFAAASISGWWQQLGQARYPDATTLTITADCGGSNGNRLRLWKTELQRLADATGLTIQVCHFPPATSKWNKIEHRLFSFISQNWRGKPLLSHEVIINLIAAKHEHTKVVHDGQYARGQQATGSHAEASLQPCPDKCRLPGGRRPVKARSADPGGVDGVSTSGRFRCVRGRAHHRDRGLAGRVAPGFFSCISNVTRRGW